MLKREIIDKVEKWGYILVYSDYSGKARSNIWTVKVPITAFKNRPWYTRTLKIIKDDDLEKLRKIFCR